jgi:hypothetical protein
MKLLCYNWLRLEKRKRGCFLQFYGRFLRIIILTLAIATIMATVAPRRYISIGD